MGGPTGEVHELDPQNGQIGQKLQEIMFVSQKDLVNEDKTRKALVSDHSTTPTLFIL